MRPSLLKNAAPKEFHKGAIKHGTVKPSPHLAPFFRWPGGKRRLILHIASLVPNRFSEYYEPFFGGGALFFHLRPRKAVISDSNPDLMNAYLQIRDCPEKLIAVLRKWKAGEDPYYKIRALRPTSRLEAAGRFIYLTTYSFNGLYRVNHNGDFNVPYGHRPTRRHDNHLRLRVYSEALRNTRIETADFSLPLADAGRHALVYLDPPYTVAHGDNGFLKYNEQVFSWFDQQRLREVTEQLANRGCKVIVSNADHPSVVGLFRGFRSIVIERPSLMAADRLCRRMVTERVFFN